MTRPVLLAADDERHISLVGEAQAETVPMPRASAEEHVPLMGHGEWSFTILHGDVEDPVDRDVLDQLARLAERTGHLLTTYGSHDTTCYVFDAAGGRIAVLALQAEATVFGRFWWRTHTRFGGDQ